MRSPSLIAAGARRWRPPPEPGMGAIPHETGVAFRVWAPHAEAVSVVGAFNDWDKTKHPLTRENDEGYWYADVPGAKVGDEYRFHLKTPVGRAVADRPVRPRGDQLGRQRRRPRPALRLGRGVPQDAAVERVGHLRAARRHVQRPEAGRSDSPARSTTSSAGSTT